MKTFAEFNNTMSNLAKAIKSGFGRPHDYARLFTIDNRACWRLVEMIRFEDPDFYESVFAHLHDRYLVLKKDPTSEGLNKLMEDLAYMIIERVLHFSPSYGLFYDSASKD
jgi:hypothetical protein